MIFPTIANPWVLLGALLTAGAIATTAYVKGLADGRQDKQAEIDRADKQRAFESQRNGERVRESEDTLAAKADEGRKADAETIRSLNARVADLDKRLRERPSRPPTTGASQSACVGPDRGTGAGLYREDGLFLSGEAASAQRIRVQRDTCYQRYADAQAELKALGAKSQPLEAP